MKFKQFRFQFSFSILYLISKDIVNTTEGMIKKEWENVGKLGTGFLGKASNIEDGLTKFFLTKFSSTKIV